MDKCKIYCAGPLFNDFEKEEMELIARALEMQGYVTFLPHRDGFEYAKVQECFKHIDGGIIETNCNYILSKAIFALDVYEIISSEGFVLNMNGRVPDEGAMVEAGVAWANNKKIVIYKNDSRSLINGTDNPLVVGLSDFTIVNSIQKIPVEFDKLFKTSNTVINKNGSIISAIVEQGKRISECAPYNENSERLCLVLKTMF